MTNQKNKTGFLRVVHNYFMTILSYCVYGLIIRSRIILMKGLKGAMKSTLVFRLIMRGDGACINACKTGKCNVLPRLLCLFPTSRVLPSDLATIVVRSPRFCWSVRLSGRGVGVFAAVLGCGRLAYFLRGGVWVWRLVEQG